MFNNQDIFIRKRTHYFLYTSIAVLVLVAVILAGIFFSLNPVEQTWSTLYDDPELSEDQVYVFGEKDPELSGKILMSLAPKAFANDIKVLPFMFDFERQVVVDTEMDVYGEDSYGVSRDLMMSPNRQWAAFYGATASDASSGEFDAQSSLQIYRASLSSLSQSASIIEEFQAIKEGATRVSYVSGSYKTLSDINGAGGVLMSYVESGSEGDSVRPVEDYTIRYLPPKGGEISLTTGRSPKWLNENVFVYLKNDGVYTYTLSSNVEDRLFSYSGQSGLSSNSMMDVSKDGTLIAVSIPDARKLIIFEVHSDDEVERYGTIETSGFWPVFSPSGNFVALQEVDWDQFENTDNWRAIDDPEPQLSLWRVDSLSKLDYFVDLSEYHQDYIFVSDWID